MGGVAPGWYPDPSGGPGMRYWDGRNWGAAAAPQAAPTRKGWSPLAITAAVIGGAVVLLWIIGSAVGSPKGADVSEYSVTRACQETITDHLKDPDSAKFSDWSMHQNGQSWTGGGLVNAKNSFGGYTGSSYYTCDATVSGTKINVHAREQSPDGEG